MFFCREYHQTHPTKFGITAFLKITEIDKEEQQLTTAVAGQSFKSFLWDYKTIKCNKMSAHV